jgi:fagellar hook-basal body proteins
MEVLANNLTNVETTAYKSDSLISSTFGDMMIERLNDPNVISANNIVGALGTGTHVEAVYTSFVQGSVEETNRPCDFALQGDGFFVISTAKGDRYTRDGSFSVNDAGYLVTSEGQFVRGSGGRIYVGGDDFKVDGQGNIYVGGALTDRFEIVTFEDLGALRKDGGNLYYSVSGRAIASTGTVVMQGSLEGSNVDTAEELTRLLSVSNAYQLNQRVLTIVDQSLDKTVNEVGRVG